MAGTRVFAHEDIHDELVEGVKNMAQSFQIGHGLIETNDFGPLISQDQRNRVMKYIKQGISEGATLVCGGNEINEKGFFIEPTIFTNVTGDMTIAKEEIFGPVLCIKNSAMSHSKVLLREQMKPHMVYPEAFGPTTSPLATEWLL